MAYIEFHQALVTHKKVLKMAGALKMRRAHVLGHLALLWCWALDNAPDGDLTDIDDEAIKLAADWPKKAEAFIGAAIYAGFIDNGSGRVLHDWQDYGGKLVAERQASAQRMRKHRATLRARDAHVRSRVEKSREEKSRVTTTGTRDVAFGQVVQAYEDFAGTITVTVSSEIGELYDEKVPPAWFMEAFAEAARANVRKWSYAKAIIQRWQRDGFKADTRRRNGADQGLSAATRSEFAAFAPDSDGGGEISEGGRGQEAS